ncbi:MAG: hypothetical protein NTU80_11160 [Verrucomicrobia bacterium]|nr:hypothetical protein [Verrucomicrobiota bacterium]
MKASPVICFGQQPCGFFPRRFLYAKFVTARRLQAELGGEIVFFYHDSDHDPRETQTTLRHRKTDIPLTLNFTFLNKTQRKFTPLYAKKIPPGWHEQTARQLPAYVAPQWVRAFKEIPASATTVADFCLELYRSMALLDGIRVVRSSDPAFRRAACPIADYFVDVPHEGELVRARRSATGSLQLHEGGNSFITLPATPYTAEQISPARDSRLRWMQSVLGCTHYIAGAGEQAYLNPADAPEITFVARDPIDRSDEAYTDA